MLGRVLPVAARAAFAPCMLSINAAASKSAASALVARSTPTVSPTFRLSESFAHLRIMEEPVGTNSIVMELLNRNARRPKKANHGKRPCSHFRRRQKRLSRRKNN